MILNIYFPFKSVDDRTAEERGLVPLKNNKFVLEKSRYDTTDCYIYPCSESLVIFAIFTEII